MSRCRRCRCDLADWNWKHNHDTGAVYEQLFVGGPLQVETARRQAPVLCRRLDSIRCDQGRTRRDLELEAESAPPRDQSAQGRDVSGQTRGDGSARDGRRRRGVRLSITATRARRRSPAISIISTRSRPPTSIPWCSPSRTTTPSGIIASAGVTIPASFRRRSSTPAPATGRTSTAPARSCSAISCRATPTPTSRTRITGAPRRSTASIPSCRWSTRWSIAPSRMRRRSSPRCAPASSIFSRPSDGRRSTS